MGCQTFPSSKFSLKLQHHPLFFILTVTQFAGIAGMATVQLRDRSYILQTAKTVHEFILRGLAAFEIEGVKICGTGMDFPSASNSSSKSGAPLFTQHDPKRFNMGAATLSRGKNFTGFKSVSAHRKSMYRGLTPWPWGEGDAGGAAEPPRGMA